MKKNKHYLHNAYNATSTDDGNGDIETYENWLERQLLSRIETIEDYEILDKLPAFIQKGNKYCKLSITKEGTVFVLKYSNTGYDFIFHGSDISQVLTEAYSKLKDPPPGYKIRFN